MRPDSHNIGLEIVRKLSRSWWQGLLVIAAVGAASVLTLISLRDFEREAVPPENRPIQSHIAGYVTSNSCRACHPGNYASWHASFHRTMTQVATPRDLASRSGRRRTDASPAGNTSWNDGATRFSSPTVR